MIENNILTLYWPYVLTARAILDIRHHNYGCCSQNWLGAKLMAKTCRFWRPENQCKFFFENTNHNSWYALLLYTHINDRMQNMRVGIATTRSLHSKLCLRKTHMQKIDMKIHARKISVKLFWERWPQHLLSLAFIYTYTWLHAKYGGCSTHNAFAAIRIVTAQNTWNS